MTLIQLIEVLQGLLTDRLGVEDETVRVDVTNIPGLGELHGCFIEGVATDGNGDLVLQAVAP